MTIDSESLYKELSDLKLIDQALLDDALVEGRQTGDGLDKILLARDLVSDENLGMLIADMLGVPFVRLERTVMKRDTLNLLPENMSRSKLVIIFLEDENTVHVAMQNPNDLATLEQVRRRVSREVKVFFATERDIRFALFAYRKEAVEVFEDVISKTADEVKKSDGDEAPIIKIVDTMMIYAYQSRASDIHVEPFEEFVQFRFRIDGVLQDIITLPKDLEGQLVTRIKILSGLPTDEHASALDGKFNFNVPEVEDVDVRVSILPATHGERVVMRLLASNMRQFALLDLGLSEENISKVRAAYSKPYGMILSTGPTGSGKTTTMYAFMKILNKRNVNIMTIEDPVEYQIRGVNQIQVNPKTSLTFAEGLKSIVRQDPNIILVGEIRDEETASIAVNAALTGHLVLSTLHTNDAATTVPRLLEMKVEPFLVASSVNMIVAQRLVRKICSSCRVSEIKTVTELSADLPTDLLKKQVDKKDKGLRVYFGKGCDVCRHTGYIGRIGIYEVMPISEAIREAIVAKKDAAEIKKIAVDEGMMTMVEDGLGKVKLGLTTVDELLREVKSE